MSVNILVKTKEYNQCSNIFPLTSEVEYATLASREELLFEDLPYQMIKMKPLSDNFA